ncbi:hypothetical protein PWG71_11245 [Nocardiopsis sp. N85]|uniref:hypothetical protein n=1 Tax=Nocardiopsis sp. N85 TaxID=3029400 RepID=UPI00237F43BE|nr:hypothetical protein [Nocardiopsis sp. N85]MDE3721965.1 hypothetical protein [Nocardiopsis sp. N85]
MTYNKLTVNPEEMARAGEALREPGQMIRKAFTRLVSERGELRRIWGSGDEISDSLNKNLTPRVDMLDQFGEALVVAFDRTADEVMRSARNYQVSDEEAFDISNTLDLPTGPGGGRR